MPVPRVRPGLPPSDATASEMGRGWPWHNAPCCARGGRPRTARRGARRAQREPRTPPRTPNSECHLKGQVAPSTLPGRGLPPARHRRETHNQWTTSPSREVLTLTHQLEAAKLEEANTQLEACRRENELLKGRLEKSERDTHEFVAFFQREVGGKDTLLKKAQKRVEELELLREKENKENEKKYRERERELTTELNDLKESSSKEITFLKDDLRRFKNFKNARDELEDEKNEFARKLRQSIEERQEERDATERARILEKGALQKDYERRSKEIRKEARREMARGLDADTLKVVAQNKALSEELHFQREE